MKIDILIPTYNRSKDLLINLSYLKDEILKNELGNQIRLIVSDNCSTDDTQAVVKRFINRYPSLEIWYNRNKENIGLEKNIVKVLKLAQSDFVLFCGDDDLIAEDYLNFCLDKIKKNGRNLGCIISGLKSVDKVGNFKSGRTADFDEIEIEPGYDALITYSHLAHQMSGLLLQKKNLLSNYLSSPQYRNPYLFIFFAGYNLFHMKSIYAPKFATAVQVENEKDWGYNEIGLLDEVFKSYSYFKNVIDEKRWIELLVHFMRMHSYRLNIDPLSPLLLLGRLKLIKKSVKSRFSWKFDWLIFKEYIISLKRHKWI